MIGLYYLPIPTICHEAGMTPKGASKSLARVSEGGFAHYDYRAEYVWIPEMASYQIATSLKPADKRVKGVINELIKHRKTKYFNEFLDRYGEVFHLDDISPFEAPSKPLRSKEKETEKETDKDKEKEIQPSAGPDIPYAEIVIDLNLKTKKRYPTNPVSQKTKALIKARWNDGYRVDDFKHVHEVKAREWLKTDSEKYLRPETLYGNKFEGYRQQTNKRWTDDRCSLAGGHPEPGIIGSKKDLPG